MFLVQCMFLVTKVTRILFVQHDVLELCKPGLWSSLFNKIAWRAVRTSSYSVISNIALWYIFQNLRVKYYKAGDRVSETELAKGGFCLLSNVLYQPLMRMKTVREEVRAKLRSTTPFKVCPYWNLIGNSILYTVTHLSSPMGSFLLLSTVIKIKPLLLRYWFPMTWICFSMPLLGHYMAWIHYCNERV